MALAVIDIGGTSIKFAIWNGIRLTNRHSLPSPKNLDDYYKMLTSQVAMMKESAQINGVAISTPGAVDQGSGVISGSSALGYTLHFPIRTALQQKLGLPVSLENDANCAALGELKYGAARGKKRVAMFVIGTGVGGALIEDGKLVHGAHLSAGEFGYMLLKGKILTDRGTPGNQALAYQAETDELISGKELFDRAASGDAVAIKYTEDLYDAIANAVYNLQYSVDPEMFLIGGAISNNKDLLPGIYRHIDKLMYDIDIAEIRPDIRVGRFSDRSNLMGAIANFYLEYPGRLGKEESFG